jgi:zinc protease
MDSIALNVTEAELAHGERLFFAPTGVKNVVSIEGSVLGGWSSLPRTKAEIPLIVTELLDAGTKEHGKDAIRETLASKGASISFRDGVDRTFFSASCFPEDLPYVLATIAECLDSAVMAAKEVENAKARELGDFTESLTDTRTLAADALSRLLFAPGHVNYTEPVKARMKNLAEVTRTDALAFRRSLGRSGLVLAVTGDIEVTKARKAAEKAFSMLGPGLAQAPSNRPNAKPNAVAEMLVPIRDKANIDTYLGTSLPFTYDDARYLPFTVLADMLGGRGLTTGHLMRTIRERDGYTYGIRSQMTGFTRGTHGSFRVWATFSPHNFKEAVAATRKEIGIFLKSGLTEDALATKKDEARGSYLIGLSTTRGLANALHKIGAEGKSLSYIDELPNLIQAVTLAEIKHLAPLIAPGTFSLAASGTFPKI